MIDFTKGTGMAEDYREVGWPKKQVERLDAQIEELSREINDRLDALRGRVVGLGNGASHLSVRLAGIESRLSKNGEPIEAWTDRQLEKMASSLRGMERQLNAESEEIGVLHETLRNQAHRFEVIEAALMAYGIPIEGGSTQLITNSEPPRMAMEGPLDSPTDPREAYDRGFSAGKQHQAPRSFEAGKEVGRAAAVLDAEVRVREYMTGNFATATLEAVVGLIRQSYQPKNSD